MNRARYIQVVFGGIMLVSGCCIYLLFRSKTLRIYQWCSAMGVSNGIDYYRGYLLSWHIPDVVKYSFPDGLYNASYILIMDAIWNKENSFYKYLITLFAPIFTIVSELLQYFGVIKGTFDIYDLACYTMPVIIYTTIEMSIINNLKTNKV